MAIATKAEHLRDQSVSTTDPFSSFSATAQRPAIVEVSREYAASLQAAFAVQSPLNSASFVHNGRVFCSRSEAACAAMLAKYVKGYSHEEGVTYQVPLGRSEDGGLQCADFMVRDVLFEYHPPRFWQNGNRSGDFDTMKEYLDYVRARKEMERADRKAFKEETLKELSQRYADTRQALINANPYLVGSELVVATSPEDFYQKVICRFSKNPPPITKFLYEFKQVRAEAEEIKRRKAA